MFQHLILLYHKEFKSVAFMLLFPFNGFAKYGHSLLLHQPSPFEATIKILINIHITPSY